MDFPPRQATFLLPESLRFARFASQLRPLGFSISEGGQGWYREIRLDTGDWRLLKRGAILSLLRRDGRWRLRLELRGDPPREEAFPGQFTPWAGGAASPALKLPPSAITEEVLRLASPRALLAVLDAQVHVQEFEIGAEGESPLGLTVRRCRIRNPLDAESPRARLALMTATPGVGPSEALERLTAALKERFLLSEAPGDLLQAGFLVLEGRIPGEVPPGLVPVGPSDTGAAAARKILSAQIWRMKDNRAGTLGDWDPEFLHDMRVAVRRLRSALRLLGPMVGESRARSLRTRLAWLAGALGAVRDLDVFLEDLDRSAPHLEDLSCHLAPFRAALQERRGALRRPLERALLSARYGGIVRALERCAAARGGPRRPGPQATVAAIAPDLLGRALDRVLKAGRGLRREPSPEDLHRLRILFKRLRYACEFFRGVFGQPLEDFIGVTVSFQDCLGEHQDAIVARARILEIAADLHAARRLGLEESLALGALLQVEREKALERRAHLRRLWKSFRRDSRRFRRSLAQPSP